jgi:hypothetical protein
MKRTSSSGSGCFRLAAKTENRLSWYVFGVAVQEYAILDEEAVLTTLAYVDLNLAADGLAKTGEASPQTSVKARVERCREIGTLEAVVDQPVDRTKHDEMLEDDLWQDRLEKLRDRIFGTVFATKRAGINRLAVRPLVHTAIANQIEWLRMCLPFRPSQRDGPP